MSARELTADALNALPIGAVVVPASGDTGYGAMTAGWRKVDPSGPNGPWLRVDESEGMVSTNAPVLAAIGVRLPGDRDV